MWLAARNKMFSSNGVRNLVQRIEIRGTMSKNDEPESVQLHLINIVLIFLTYTRT
jgi:hypothetical protein